MVNTNAGKFEELLPSHSRHEGAEVKKHKLLIWVIFWQFNEKLFCFRYEYEFPDNYIRPWRHFFPDQDEVTSLVFLQSYLSQVGFDEFLNRHRDPKDIEKEVLEKKLANTDPFKGDRCVYGKATVKHESPMFAKLCTVIRSSC